MSAPSVCPIRGICTERGLCENAGGCILDRSPLILTPMSDWRANPLPFPLRQDAHARAVWPQGVA